MVEVMKVRATSFKRSQARTAAHSVLPALQQATASPRLHQRLLDTHRQVWAVSCGATAPFSWVLVCTRFCLCPPRVCFPVLCKFWQHYVGVNGDLLQEGLCHTQMCCIQSPCPCSRPLLTLPPQETLKHSSVLVSVGILLPLNWSDYCCCCLVAKSYLTLL